ncbi:MAG TPA: hypothetical protein VHV55_16495 [Pirellulales bacterium]|jgi:hypothetical protein|nr:hypothetical protein [Pirellulales bacterium]
MNLVGKILVFLIFVMSLVFMGFAVSVYSTHKNWIEVAQRTQQQLQDSQAETQKAQAALDAYKEQVTTEKKGHDEAIAKLSQKFDDLNKEKTAVDAQLAALKEESAKQLAALTTAQTSLDARLKQIDDLRNDVVTAHAKRDEKFNEYVALQDKYNVAEAELSKAKEMSARLAEQAAQSKVVLDLHGLSPHTPVGNMPPKVDGIVLATGTNGLVEISLGADDGLHPGNMLEVSRGANYLGRVEVLRTAPDKSVAKVVPGYQKGKIARDDRVATRLQ